MEQEVECGAWCFILEAGKKLTVLERHYRNGGNTKEK